ncbi:DNA-binding protein YbiB [Uliginosibacterium gangwonense]|uniref:DNA-binding protein YbiB n=1 Tax=Uliginosibacterium gangwonense TaxID=392736 RepID=UPI00037C2EC0|nr:DNA-binding protein YbiB [Uliginosibacterium gangwonense]
MEFAPIIKEIGRGAKGARSMDATQAEALFAALLDGLVPDMEVGAILLALRIKGETPEELAGFKAALDARTRQVDVPEGPCCVILPAYNGARKHPNLMPLVALLLARQNIPVLIQGRHDFDARVSPFKLLEALGVPTQSSLQEASGALATHRIASLRLDLIARGLDWLLSLRLRLGVRNCGHTLAKLLDPCKGRSVRVVPVTHPAFMDAMETLLAQERATALLMRGTEGEAYAAPRRRPRLLGLSHGIAEVLFEQAEFAGEETREEGCELEANAALIHNMLTGQTPVPQPILDQVSALADLARRA